MTDLMRFFLRFTCVADVVRVIGNIGNSHNGQRNYIAIQIVYKK